MAACARVCSDVEPLGGRLLLFFSDNRVPHEVLAAHRDRFAVTVWFFDRDEKRLADEAAQHEETLRREEERVRREMAEFEAKVGGTTVAFVPPSLQAVRAVADTDAIVDTDAIADTVGVADTSIGSATDARTDARADADAAQLVEQSPAASTKERVGDAAGVVAGASADDAKMDVGSDGRGGAGDGGPSGVGLEQPTSSGSGTAAVAVSWSVAAQPADVAHASFADDDASTDSDDAA